MSTDDDRLLDVEGLRTVIDTDRGTIDAVDGVDFGIDRGETVCLVGESGSGKSVTCQSITGIVPQPPASIEEGRVVFDGTDLRTCSATRRREIRGDRIGHVFQNPQHSLDPVYTIGEQVVETIEIHGETSGEQARQRAIEVLRRVGIPNARDRFAEYPHQFSGGMQQRVAIAIALAANPDLLIADEPTTAVDVTVQSRLLELIAELASDGLGVLWITHDLRVVAAIADRVLVMYGGTIVERGPVDAVFDQPAHPYTRALFDSFHGETPATKSRSRTAIPTDGCRFADECPHAIDACHGSEQPTFYSLDRSDHAVSCVHYGPEGSIEDVRTGGKR